MAKLGVVLTVIGMQASQCFRSADMPSAGSEVIEHPAHMAKLAAFGKDFDEFVRNAEKNDPLLLGSGFTEINASSSLETEKGGGKGVVSQRTFCPRAWRAQIGQRGTYVGGGAFGKVYVSELTCDVKKVAIKVQKSTRETEKESKLMMRLHHPNVIKAFASSKGPGRDDTSLLMEACSGGDLEGKSSKSMTESTMARLVSEMLEGLSYMHGQDLVHSDIKKENVMLSRKCTASGLETCHSKVADLGLTCSLRQHGDCSGLAGTPLYMSPGLIGRQRRSKPDDLWAMGVMLHQMVTGRLPDFLMKRFSSVDQLLWTLNGLASKRYAYKPRGNSAKEQLLAGLLNAHDSMRINVQQAVSLAKSWMKEVGSGTVESTAPSAVPKCWGQCQTAKCDYRSSSCMLDDKGENVNCVSGEDVAAVDKAEEQTMKLLLRRRYSERLGFRTETNGPTVISVTAGGVASRAGLKVGDIIVEIQNKPWESLTQRQKIFIITQEPVVALGIKRP